jgi:WD40 repeat protein
MTRVLRLETLKRLGGAQKIVRTHLDEAMSELKPDEQDAAATIFRQLVTPSGTKIAHTVPDLADYARLPQDELTPVLEHLSGGDVRILRPVAPPPGQLDGGRYEIFHDVLAPAILDWRARYTEAKAREQAEREAAEAREQAQRERRRARIFRAVAIVAFACAILAAILGTFNYWQKQTARSRSDANRAVADLVVDPAKSIDEALAALKVKHTQAAEDALRRALSESRERRIVQVHGGAVHGVAVAPDGSLIATADDDHTVKLWKRRSGRVARILRGHRGPVNAVAFSPDGRSLATASDDKTARVWPLKGGSAVVLRHQQKVEAVALTRHARIAFTAAGGALHKWEVGTREDLWDKSAPDGGSISTLALAPKGEVVTGDDLGTVQVWNPATGAPLASDATQPFPNVAIDSVSVSHDGTYVVATSDSGQTFVWQRGTTHIWYLASAGGVPLDARFSPDDEFVAIANEDDAIRIFDWRAQKPLLELRGHTDAVNAIDFAPDGSFLVSGSDDRTARVWDASLGLTMRLPDVVQSVAFSGKGSRLAVAGWNYAWVARTGATQAFAKTQPGQNFVLGAAFQPGTHGRVVALAFENTVRFWSIARNRVLFSLRLPHGATVNGLAFTRDGKLLATAADDKRARIWNVRTGAVEHVLRGHMAEINGIAFSPDGKTVATAGADHTVRLWSAKTGKQIRKLHTQGSVNNVAFSRRRDELVAGSAGLNTPIWNYKTGKVLQKLPASSVTAVGFSPDGRFVATGGPDTLTRIWDAKSGHLVAVLREHADEIEAIAFSPTGKQILSGSADLTAKLYACVTCGSLKTVEARAKRLSKNLNG